MEMTGQITTPAAALKYMFGGKAFVTLRSLTTGNRYTYRIELADKRNPNDTDTYFVGLLMGPDNWFNYKYIGIIKNGEYRWTDKAAKNAARDAGSVKAITHVISALRAGNMDGFEVWHEGKCGRCGRKLTVPESIASGFGPECITMVDAAPAVLQQPVTRNASAFVAQHDGVKVSGTAAPQAPLASTLTTAAPAPKRATKAAGRAAAVAAPASTPKVQTVGDIDVEIRRRIEEYKANAPENYYMDGELSEQEAFKVAYNKFRVQIQGGR
jgi:hypothetical protein